MACRFRFARCCNDVAADGRADGSSSRADLSLVRLVIRPHAHVTGQQIGVVLRGIGEDLSYRIQVAEAVFSVRSDVVAFAPFIPVALCPISIAQKRAFVL